MSPVVTGAPPFDYQWQEDGLDPPWETNATLTLLNVQTNQDGCVYSLIVSNALGTDTAGMTLTVTTADAWIVNLDVNRNTSANNYSGTADPE